MGKNDETKIYRIYQLTKDNIVIKVGLTQCMLYERLRNNNLPDYDKAEILARTDNLEEAKRLEKFYWKQHRRTLLEKRYIGYGWTDERRQHQSKKMKKWWSDSSRRLKHGRKMKKYWTSERRMNKSKSMMGIDNPMYGRRIAA